MIDIIIIYLAAGVFSGFVSGLFGVGGAFALAPALVITLTLQGVGDTMRSAGRPRCTLELSSGERIRLPVYHRTTNESARAGSGSGLLDFLCHRTRSSAQLRRL